MTHQPAATASRTRILSAAVVALLLAVSPPAEAGNIFITGHDIDKHDGQQGYDTAILDFLRGESCGGNAIPRMEYKIAVIGSGGSVPAASYFWGWSDSTTAAKPGFGPVTFFNSYNLTNGTQTWADVLSNDVLVILSGRSSICPVCALDINGVNEVNAHAADILARFNAGMDIWANTGGYLSTYYDFLPPDYSVTPTPFVVALSGFTLTTAGSVLGNALSLNAPVHTRFTAWSPLLTVMETWATDTLPDGQAVISLAACNPNYTTEVDHLECYKVKDVGQQLQTIVDLDSEQFGLAEGCKIGKATKFCVPVKKTVVTSNVQIVPFDGQDLHDDRICYRVKCPKVNIQMETEDQFGPRKLIKFKPFELCTPARKLPPGQLSVVKVNDIDGDGVRDLNEPLIPGWVFDVTSTSPPYTASLATGPTGIANFPSLLSGEYTITEQMQPGWIATGPSTQTATIIPGSATTVTFTNRFVSWSQIYVFKYHDLDGDGEHDVGEPGIENWPISVAGSGGTQNGTTDAGGHVDFFPLMPGEYTVSEGSRPGWSPTSPNSVDLELQLAMGDSVRFGNQCSCAGVPGSVCGDGVQSPCEQCDDGNLANGDGCNQCCGIEVTECGNGVVEAGEDCDPPGTICPFGDACQDNCTCTVAEECDQSAPMCDGHCDVAGQACVSSVVQQCAIDLTPCVTPADCPSPGDDCVASSECSCHACDQVCIGGSNDGAACITDAQCPGGVCAVPPCCCMPSGGPACSTDADCGGDSCVCP